MNTSHLGLALLLLGAAAAIGCAGAPGYRGSMPASPDSPMQPSAAKGYGAPSSPGYSDSSERSEGERAGLGTGWGETRYSPTSTTAFLREDPSRPFLATALYYNDEAGANAMARISDYRSYDRGWYPVHGGMVSLSLRDSEGRPFPSFYAGGRNYVVGEAGARYVILIQNNSGYRFECVASVDGLDVTDGQPASYHKRGYVLNPYSTLEIDGFRRSEEAVAAFRFSSVRGSYSSQSGQGDRNVGVIGVALFQERGQSPRWSEEEVDRRHSADPFPQRYARPPRY